MADRIGQQLGNYRLVRLLGEGGYAEVYLGEHVYLDKPAAIKVLRTQLARDGIEQFRLEAKRIAYLEHPHIVHVLDLGVEGTTPFLVMSYAPGGTLRQRHPKGTLLPLPLIVQYVKQVAEALQYAHEERFIHRDVKPENMLLGRHNELLLSDFGIATIVHSTTSLSVQAAAGTVPYMAPEQLQEHPRPASDQYALGVVVYEWLCGNRPFDGAFTEVVVKHLTIPPPPLRGRMPTISSEVEQVVMTALAKDYKQRFGSVQAFAQALEKASQVAPSQPVLPTQIRLPSQPAATSVAADLPIQFSRLREIVRPTSPEAVPTGMGTPTIPTVAPIEMRKPVGPTAGPTEEITSSSQTSLSIVANVVSPIPAVAPSPTTSLPPPSPFAQVGARGQQAPQQPPRTQGRSNVGRNFLLIVLAIFLIAGVAYAALNYIHHTASSPTSTPGATTTPVPSLPNGIGVTKAADGEYIGISDGTFAFDTNRHDGRFKTQAADKLKTGDVGGAESLWQSGLATDTNDAEALIYLEDQQVLASGNPYVTFVVGTMITGDNIGVGRDDLQGAYVAQKEYNDGHKLPNNVEVRLLIANSGNVSAYATSVAQQIVQVAQQDHTIVGVMGWPFSSRTKNAVGVLARAHIPMVSQTASDDKLTGASPFFFRVAPSNKGQAIAGAQYAEQVLHAHNLALFVDPANSYSSSLAADFSQKFLADGNHIVVTENYTVGSQGQGKLPTLLQDALNHNPDLIYFSGYATDISVLLTNLPTAGPYASLQILGGDALYEVSGYSSSARANFTRLHFTAFAYPDEWDNGGLGAQKPAFFNEYIAAYNPNGQQPGGKYGYTRPSSDVILSYDATLALLTASKMALSAGGNGKSITTEQLRQALTQITAAQPLQGVSGRIAFGPDGNPINKAFVILAVDVQGHIHEVGLQGCFLVGTCS